MADHYVFANAVRGLRDGITGDAASLLSAVATVVASHASTIDHNRFAADALAALQVHPALRSVARVCLVQRVPDASMLWVLGSANHRSIRSNAVTEGYHCFVAEHSSLVGVCDGRVRSFSDAQHVLRSFEALGLPPQRTFRLVASMGLRSGMCQGLASRGAAGYLFINATEIGVFDRLDDGVALAIGLLGKAAAARMHSVPANLRTGIEDPARRFRHHDAAEALQEAFRRRFHALPASIDLEDAAVAWCQHSTILGVLEGVSVLASGDPSTVALSAKRVAARHLRWEIRMLGRRDDVELPRRSAWANHLLAPWSIAIDPAQAGGVQVDTPIDAEFVDEIRDGLICCYSI